jgi:hypothetical protein
MKRYDIINRFIKERGYKDYLEIGVYTGQCMREVIAENRTGVDPGSEGHIAEEVTHPVTSDAFFKSIKGSDKMYDIIFIDGLHHSYQVDVDIENALVHLKDGGVIVMHDCNPEQEVYTLVPRVSPIWHGDVYKSVLRFRSKSLHSFFTVDTDCGCGVIFKDYKGDSHNSVEDYKKALSSWSYFFDNKQRLLNLISVEDFIKTDYNEVGRN